MEVSFIALETRERLFARERERQEFTFDDTLSRFRGNIYICVCVCVCIASSEKNSVEPAQSMHMQEFSLSISPLRRLHEQLTLYGR